MHAAKMTKVVQQDSVAHNSNMYCWKKAVFVFQLVLCMVVAVTPELDPLQAQDETKKEDQTIIELSKLDTFLKNKDGSLIQYFNITYDEFKEVYDAIRSEVKRSESNEYSIRKVDVQVKSRSYSALIDIELTVIPRTDNAIDVPIGFDNAFFSDVDFNRDLVRKGKKYYVRIKGKQDVASVIKLRSVQEIEKRLGGKQLDLELPPAVFSSVQIHDTDKGLSFSANQDSINKTVEPFFKNGSSYQFEGLAETSTITWGQQSSGMSNRPGEVGRDLTITANVEEEQIRYEASLSVSSSDPFSEIEFELPVSSANVELRSELGTLSNIDSSLEGWKTFRIEFENKNLSFDNIQLSWTIPKQGNLQRLVGMQVNGFDFSDGQITVQADEPTSFVLADRRALANQVTIEPNRHFTYSMQSLDYSALVYSVFTEPKNQKLINLNLRLGAESSTLEMQLPPGISPKNPADVSIQLNGWKLVAGQANLNVDSLLRQVDVSPIFFLSENQSRRVLFSLDQSTFGESEFQFPKLTNLDVDAFRIRISCSEDVNARFERSKNPSLDVVSEFESEIISFGKIFSLTAPARATPKVNLRLDPVLPFVEGKRHVRLKESRGGFIVESRCTVKSSRDFDAIALLLKSNNVQLTIDGESIDLAGLTADTPFVIDLENPTKEITVDQSIDLGELSDVDSFDQPLADFLLPTIPGSSEAGISVVEAQGRNFARISVQSTLSVLTPSGTKIEPDNSWLPSGTVNSGNETFFAGKNASNVRFEKSSLSDEDVHVWKLWCHTRLSNDLRQDSVAIRFTPNRSVVQWKIPEGTKLVSCRLNGKPFGISWTSDQSFVDTRFDEFDKEQLIEFELRFFYTSNNNFLTLKLPKTNRLLWTQNMYWSLDLPDNRYVLNYSEGLSGAYVLDWTGFFLQPAPKMNHRQLQRWILADQDSAIEQQGNEYLFSSFGMGDERYVYIISKRNLVLVFGLFFITFGCAFVSLSFMRNSLFLVAIAAGVLIFGMWYPIWFVQLLQIEIFVGFLFGVGFIFSRFASWVNPAKDETRIETNVPSLVFAAPDSGVNQSAETRSQLESESKDDQ